MLHHFIYRVRLDLDTVFLDEIVADSEDEASWAMRQRYGPFARLTKISHQYCIDVNDETVKQDGTECAKEGEHEDRKNDVGG